MITDKELAKIQVRRIVFHDVPYNRKGGTSEPKLANTETKIDAERAAMLKRRLVQVLGSKSAYPICFWSGSQSPIPAEVRAFTGDYHGAKKFVEMSQKLARYLFELQTGAMSPGLLCVIDCVVSGDSAIAVLKLEREQGVELEMKEEDGKRSFEIEVLDDLVLTDGTRLLEQSVIRGGTVPVLILWSWKILTVIFSASFSIRPMPKSYLVILGLSHVRQRVSKNHVVSRFRRIPEAAITPYDRTP